MSSSHKLIASYFTLAGEVRPLEGSIVSPRPLRERIEAAGKAGFDGFGFCHEDLEHVLGIHNHSDIRSMLNDNGQTLCEIEVLQDWFCDDERRVHSDAVRKQMLQDAEALEAIHIKVGGDLSGGNWPVETLVESFAKLCDEALDAGTKVCIELFPASNFSNLEIGLAVVDGADRSNGGLLLDIWHMTRAGVDFADIAKLSRERIIHVELNDGPAKQTGPIIPETIDKRVHCGQGEFDLPGFLQSISKTGYDGPFGVEVLSHEQRAIGVEEGANRAFSHAKSSLDNYFH